MEKKYEFVLATVDEEKSKNLSTLISSGSKIIDQISVGQRSLAYPIKKNSEGFYSHILISTSIENFDSIKKDLDFNKDCLRYLTYSSKRNDLKPEKERSPRPEKENISKDSKNQVTEKVDKPKTIKKLSKKVEKIEEKVKINELDEKLKKLLEE